MLATDRDLDAARRIVVYGVTGSGKSTLARRLAEARGVPLLDGDAVGWLPGWEHRDPEEQRAIVTEFLRHDAWVSDSAWRVWSDLVLGRADLVVALDLPRHVSLARLVRRTAVRLVRRDVVCNGNVESWRTAFSGDSVVAWHVRSFARKRAAVRAWAEDPAAPPVLLLASPAEVADATRRLTIGSGVR